MIDEHESGGETKSKTECPVRIADRKEIGVRWIVDTMNIKWYILLSNLMITLGMPIGYSLKKCCSCDLNYR